MSGPTVWSDLTSTSVECGKLAPGPERDACYIRHGFQVTGPNQYSKSTGIQVTPMQLLPFVPVVGDVVAAVGSAVNAIKAPSGATPTALVAPTAVPISAPMSAAATSAPSPVLDTNMMLLLGVGAIVLLFAMRH